MKKDLYHIKQLLSLYHSGMTTLAQEHELMEFFAVTPESALPDDMKADKAGEEIATAESATERITEFNMNVIDKICDIVPAVKVQIAYYEMYGYEGLKAFNYTVNYARGRGMIVIADCKRNDIGSTAGCYSKAYLGRTKINKKYIEAFPADMLTVNGYLGFDVIKPFIENIKTKNDLRL